jgi:hypothetical protein
MDPRPRPDVSSRIVDGEVVVLDHENEKIHQLNATASFVWSRLDGTLGLSGIAKELTEHFEVTEQRALADVKRIVQEFEDLQLVMPRSN